jgi:hypothetical protein|tara:strand:- start:82 stop:675 length:594 start_codon:yes stop_codon:yes gene_type:complete
MQSLYYFIIKPIEKRYNNTKKIGDKDFILNTEIQDHKFVSRNAKVIHCPINVKSPIKQGDEIIVHHNVFRRFNDIRGNEKDSSSSFVDGMYFVYLDQIFAYRHRTEWKPIKEYCFVKPISNDDKFSTNKEKENTGIIKYVDNKHIKKQDLIGFTPDSEYEFIINNERLYRVPIKSICIKYEYKGNEKEYNPSWLQSG